MSLWFFKAILKHETFNYCLCATEFICCILEILIVFINTIIYSQGLFSYSLNQSINKLPITQFCWFSSSNVQDKLFIFFFCFVISCNHKINTTYSALHQIWIKVGTHKNWVASSTPTHPQANKAFCSCYALATEIFH